MLWRRADKARRAQIDAARASIDEWIATRPPPYYYSRVYSLPSDDAVIPSVLRRLRSAVRFIKQRGLMDFEIAFPEEAQHIEAELFAADAERLLMAPVSALLPLTGLEAAPDISCELLVCAAYGMLQTFAWMEQVGAGPKPNGADYVKAATWAQQAKQVLGSSGKAGGDWLDTVIRIDAVIAQAMLRVGRADEAIGKLLYMIGWYMAAEKLGHHALVRKRHNDWLQALYAIVDYGYATQHQAWISTASALIKDLRIGQRQVDPFRVEPVPRAWNGSVMDLHLQAAFVETEWQRGLDRLGAAGAVIDIVVTDRFVHTRLFCGGRSLVNGGGVRAFRSELPRLERPAPPGEKRRYVRPITPTSCVLEPAVSGPTYAAAMLSEEWTSTRPSSEVMRWGTHFQKVGVSFDGDRWTWSFRWSGMPASEHELWSVVYRSVFADAVEAAAASGVRHLVISPDGSLSAMPVHLLRCLDGARLGDRFLVSFAPNLTGVLTVLDVDPGLQEAQTVIVEDPTGTVGFAAWECREVASAIGNGVNVVRGQEATAARLKVLCADASIIHFTGHATFDWANPDTAFLRLAGDDRLTLDDLRGFSLKPGALVFLSACDTGRRGIAKKRSSSRGIVSALLEAGAATVICTLWPVHSIAAALVASWFYECWATLKMSRLESLKEATRRLMVADRATCESKVGCRIYMPGAHPFADEYYWGAFVLQGAW